MHLNVLFFLGGYVYDDNVWFCTGLNLFSLHFSLVYLGFHVVHGKNIATLELIFFLDSIPDLFEKITSN
jgi:hypothetical protein